MNYREIPCPLTIIVTSYHHVSQQGWRRVGFLSVDFQQVNLPFGYLQSTLAVVISRFLLYYQDKTFVCNTSFYYENVTKGIYHQNVNMLFYTRVSDSLTRLAFPHFVVVFSHQLHDSSACFLSSILRLLKFIGRFNDIFC